MTDTKPLKPALKAATEPPKKPVTTPSDPNDLNHQIVELIQLDIMGG